MIFQHTIDKVLSGEKTQTSRIWKDNWATSFISPNSDAIRAVYSCHDKQPFKRLRHEVGQVLSVQPARGAEGVAHIRILELTKRDVRDFSYEDIAREGFDGYENFIALWVAMHDKWLAKVMNANRYSNISSRAAINAKSRPSELYTALVLRFELIAELRWNSNA